MTKKALFLSFDRVPGTGPVGQHLAKLVPELSERMEVDALSLKADELAHIQRLGQARMMRVPTPEAGGLEAVAAYQRAVVRQLDSDAYDCVYCTDLFSAYCVASHEPARGVPLISDLFDLPAVSFDERYDFFAGDPRAPQELKQHETAALAASTRVIVHSDVMRRALIDRGADATKIAMIRVGVDTELFAPPSIEVRAEPHAFMIAAVIEPVRRPFIDTLLQALSQAPSRTKLVLMGTEIEQDMVTELAEQHHVQRRVQLEHTSSSEELAAAIGAVDAVVVWWGFTEATLATGIVPVATLNVFACGRPVVASDSPGVRELLGATEAALLCAHGDRAALVQAINDLESSSALRKRLGTRGQELVNDRHAWERVMPSLLKIIEGVVSGAPLPIISADDSEAPTPPPPPLDDQPPPGEVMHTPIVPRPRRSPTPPAPMVPEPVALGVSDEHELEAPPVDPWAHDTIATPTNMLHEPPPDEGTPGAIPGLRSVAIMDDVPARGIYDEETEIRPRGAPPTLNVNEETERVYIDDKLADRLRQQPLPQAIADDEETVRMPAFSAPELDPSSPEASTPAPGPPPVAPPRRRKDEQRDEPAPPRGDRPDKKK